MWYRGYLALLLVAALGTMSCNEDDIIAAAAGDPVPSGMGVMATSASVAGASAIASTLSAAITGSQKVSPAGLAGGVFPGQASITCFDGGNISISGTAPGDMTATFSGCADGPYTVTGTAAMTVAALRSTPACTEDEVQHDVPADLTATFNGQVVVDGQTVNFSNFGVAITNPTYDGYPDGAYFDDPTGTDGTCALVSGDIHATGVMTTEFAGQTSTIDLGQTSLNIHFEGQPTGVNLTVNGTLTVDTACTDGPFTITLTTLSDFLSVPDGDATPNSGVLQVNEDSIDFFVDPAPPIPCSGFL